MATTTNYGWETPDDTDLVKDGALAQRTTASAIDTTLFGITGGKGVGLQLLTSTDFTSQTTINFTNVFNSTYSRYRVLFSGYVAAGSPLLAFYFRENTTDKSTGYYGGGWQVRFDAATAAVGINNGNYITAIPKIGNTAGSRSIISLDIYRTATDGIVAGIGFNGSDSGVYLLGANNNAMTNFTGFSLAPNSSTLTGSVKIYGYKESV